MALTAFAATCPSSTATAVVGARPEVGRFRCGQGYAVARSLAALCLGDAVKVGEVRAGRPGAMRALISSAVSRRARRYWSCCARRLPDSPDEPGRLASAKLGLDNDGRGEVSIHPSNVAVDVDDADAREALTP